MCSWLKLVVTKGPAEMFGVELALNREYSFSGCKRAVLTWQGCDITTNGGAEAIYKTSRGETTAGAALKVHAYLEARREKAARSAALELVGGVYGETSLFGGGPAVLSGWTSETMNARGPRALIVGPTDSGKSTLCTMLCAYAARLGREPIFVDLDPCLGDAGGPPGSISATRVDMRSLSVDEGFASPDLAPLTWWFGYESPAENPELYDHVVDKVALAVADRLSTDIAARAAGVIVNTCGWVDNAGLAALKHAAASFGVDVILVLAHDKLYQELKAAVPPDVLVANLPRSRGVVDRDHTHRRRARHKRIHEYFYGPTYRPQSELGLIPLAPSTLELRFRDVKLFKVLARDAAAVDSMLPVGQGSMLDPLQVVAVTPSTALVHNLLVACHPPPTKGDTDDYATHANILSDTSNPYQFLLDCAAAGFVVVTNVNTERATLTLLTPCSGDLPTNYLLLGKIEWMEASPVA